MENVAGTVLFDCFVDRRRLSGVSPKLVKEDIEIKLESFSEEPIKPSRNSCLRVSNDYEAQVKHPGELVIAVNAGGTSPALSSSGIQYIRDQLFAGGDVLRTEEIISGTSEPALYQTARYGNVSYNFTDLPPGNYFVDLHFSEIVFTDGPSGMRVFDVYMQSEKVISDLDVYAEVGCNKALILCGKTSVTGGTLQIVFKGVIGNPIISAICVRRATFLGTPVTPSSVGSQKSVGEENKGRGSSGRKSAVAYDAKVEELKNECHEAWISLQDANRRIEKLQIDAVSKSVTIDTLASAVETQENEMKDLREAACGGKQKLKDAALKLYREIEEVKSEYGTLAKETKDWISSLPDASGMISSVQSLVKEHEILKSRFAEQSVERRQLYNEVLELQGNIRVFCRCRPLSAFEVSAGTAGVVDFDALKDNELIVRNGNTKKLFKFDRVFTPLDDQGVVFANTAPVVVSVLDGYNVCIIAYGQTGTGKTFTMEGTSENRGVNFRTLEELFEIAEHRKTTFAFQISVSVLEVYNEQIRDLLAPPPEFDQPAKKLEIRQLAEGGHHVPGLVEAQVNCIEEVWEVLQTGSSARAVESTNANQHSSRSHCMLCVMVKAQNLITGECTRSKLWLVDLAGSERVAKTDVQGDRLREAQSINKSLSALGDVIAALTTKSSHVPFRNSKLTHLLQDSLGGDSKALMFVQISPSEEDVGESLCSLNFASRVKGVELGPARKQIDSSELFKFKQLAERAKQEGRTKEDAMKKMEDTLRNTDIKLRIKENLYQNLIDKMKEKDKAVVDLEAQLAAEKKARLAAQVCLKEKSTQYEKVLSTKDARNQQQLERRPLQEKTQEASVDASHNKGGSGTQTPCMSPVAEDLKQEESEKRVLQSEETSNYPVKRVVSTRYYSPTIKRKLARMPMRASIASTYQINPAILTSSLSEDDSGADVSKENRGYSNDAKRERYSSAFNRPPTSANPVTASALFGRKKTVHFASPVFQKEKVNELRPVRVSDYQHQSSANPQAPLSSIGDDKKLGVNKIRRVSIARRASGQFPTRTTTTTTGAQRVSSIGTGGAGVKWGVPPLQPQKERRWNK